MKQFISYLLILLSFLLYDCDNFFCDPEDNSNIDSSNTENTLRFNPLDIPIDAKLLFVAGPSSSNSKDSTYNYNQWDFWKLEGTEFTKLNDISWPYFLSYRWNHQFSPNGSYFSFFDDKYGPVRNTDDIGLLNLTNFNEYYFTDSLGDANPSDEWVYQWSSSEEFIYFNSIQHGISEYDTLANSDLYRVTPNNVLEQLTDTPYFEVGVSPSPDGKYLAYIIEDRNATPDSVVGIHLLNLETMQSNMISNQNEYMKLDFRPWDFTQKINWHPSSNYFIVEIHGGDNQLLLKYSISSEQIEFLDLNEPSRYGLFSFVENSDKLLMWWYTNLANSDSSEIIIYDVHTRGISTLPNFLGNNELSGWANQTISPTGNFLAFTAHKKNVDTHYLNVEALNTDIYILNLSDYSVTQITNGLYGYEGYLRWIE